MEAFFTERLVGQRQVSPHTVAAYADTFRLLLALNSEWMAARREFRVRTALPRSRSR